jgi:hypothetical protein
MVTPANRPEYRIRASMLDRFKRELCRIRLLLGVVVLAISCPVSGTPTSTVPFIPVPGTPHVQDCSGGPPAVDGHVGCYRVVRSDVDVDVWTINRPPVDTNISAFPAIHPHAGDLVSVFAGGCAQTGGSGLTWKRYVRPMTPGQHDDSQYYGSIGIPGVIPMTPLRNALPHGAFEVPNEPGPDGFVTLQYLDNHYSDNGYWGRDDGWWQQCFRAPDAFVVIAIQHGCVPTPAPGHSCPRGLPLDLGPSRLDDNGFPLNPDYTWKLLTEAPTPAWQLCGFNEKTETMPEDPPDLCRSPPFHKNTNVLRCPFPIGSAWTAGRIAGHLNFETVTHVVDPREISGGFVSLDNHDPDDDYTFNVFRGDGTLDTESSPGKIQMEFDSDETIDYFAGPWWSKFHDAVPQKSSPTSNDTANAMIAGSNAGAIVIGLSGLDCEHQCIPELHPVYALALRLPDSTPTTEHWAFFARNSGNEGYCGTNQEPLPVDRLTIRIPRSNAIDFTMLSWEVDTTDTAASATAAPIPGGGGAWLSIALPNPDRKAVVSGEFTLKWKFDSSRLESSIVQHIRPWWINQVAWSIEPGRGQMETESVLNQVMQEMTPAQRQRAIAITKVGRPPRLHRLPLRIVRGNPPRANHLQNIQPTPDTSKQRSMDALGRIIKEAASAH